MFCANCGNESKSDKAEICTACGCRIKAKESGSLVAWGYGTAVLLPLIGGIIGVANICKGRVGHGVAQIVLAFCFHHFWIGFFQGLEGL